MGLERFTGDRLIPHHPQMPCRVSELGPFTAIERAEWVPAAHAHRQLPTTGDGVPPGV